MNSLKSSRSSASASARLSVEGEKITIVGFPDEIQSALKVFDVDGDGTVDPQELLRAAELYQQAVHTNVLLRRGVAGLSVGTVALIGCMGGLTYGIINATKETTVQGRALVAKGSSDPVATNTNEIEIPLAALAVLPARVSFKVDRVGFSSGDDETFYHRKVESIDVGILGAKSMSITTSVGDKISWSDRGRVTVAMADGTEWTKNPICASCFATNIIADDEIEGILEKFRADYYEDSNPGDRHLSGGCFYT